MTRKALFNGDSNWIVKRILCIHVAKILKIIRHNRIWTSARLMQLLTCTLISNIYCLKKHFLVRCQNIELIFFLKMIVHRDNIIILWKLFTCVRSVVSHLTPQKVMRAIVITLHWPMFASPLWSDGFSHFDLLQMTNPRTIEIKLDINILWFVIYTNYIFNTDKKPNMSAMTV